MEHIQFIIKDYQISKLGIGNIFKCLISALSVHSDTVIQCYPDYIYGTYDTILDKRFIYSGTTKELEKVYTCRLLILKDEEDHQMDLPTEEWYIGGLENPRFHHFFSFSKRIDWNYDLSKISPKVQQRLFRVIDQIQFTDMVYHEVEQWAHRIPSTSLGVSIRTWKASHEQGVHRPYEFSWYRDAIKKVGDLHPDCTTVVLSIDNSLFLEPYLEWLREQNKEVLILERKAHWNPIQYAIIKVLVLARCPFFIGNRISTFTELVFWFGKGKSIVYPIG